ncbi:MAG TPA: hypothetical protein H9666_07975 [Firmicutes bacterium]|nr:hypothetical protein [Bacillota bacterium]
MTRKRKRDMRLPMPAGTVLLLLCLALGALAGSLLFRGSLPQAQDLTAQLDRQASAGRLALFFTLFWDSLRYLVPLFLCAYFRFGAFAVPLLFAAKGFSLARTATAFLASYGLRGYGAFWLAYCINGFFVLLCLLALGSRVIALCCGQRSVPRGHHSFLRIHPGPAYYECALVCLALCLLCSLVGCILTPLFSTAALAMIT